VLADLHATRTKTDKNGQKKCALSTAKEPIKRDEKARVQLDYLEAQLRLVEQYYKEVRFVTR
jgi:hypothetical protein